MAPVGEEDEEEEASSSSPKQILRSTNTSKHTPIFLKCMVKEHVFMKVVLCCKNFSPRQFETWQKRNSVVSEVDAACTYLDN